MKNRKKRIKKTYTGFALFITFIAYFMVLAGYFIGKAVLAERGLEFRFWVETLVRIVAWFVPAAAFGIFLLRMIWKAAKRKEKSLSVVLTAGAVLYCIVAAFCSFFYILYHAFNMTTDTEMPDGNLVISIPYGMEYLHEYAEPVGIFCRRRITFDDARFADSLSKVYGVEFAAKVGADGNMVYVSDAYPGVETQIIRHGYSESVYLQNDLKYLLTSRMLEAHRDIFEKHQIELIPYLFGVTADKPEGICTVNAVLVTDENKERAAQALAEFIQMTLKNDWRNDGKSLWTNLDGSIFLVLRHEEADIKEKSRNIPFGLEPEYFWVYDENADSSEILNELEQSLGRLD